MRREARSAGGGLCCARDEAGVSNSKRLMAGGGDARLFGGLAEIHGHDEVLPRKGETVGYPQPQVMRRCFEWSAFGSGALAPPGCLRQAQTNADAAVTRAARPNSADADIVSMLSSSLANQPAFRKSANASNNLKAASMPNSFPEYLHS